MAGVRVVVGQITVNPSALAAYVRAGSGPVVADLMRRGTNVQVGARGLVRKRTRKLERSIVKRLDTRNGLPIVVIATDVSYALFEHEGTRAHVIRPRQRKVLRFPGRGGLVFAPAVHHPGTTGTKFLQRALPLAGR